MPTASDASATQLCPACRTENDPFYTYCRACLEELPSNAARSDSV